MMSTYPVGRDSVDTGSDLEEAEARWRWDCRQGTDSESRSVKEKARKTNKESPATEKETEMGKEAARLLDTSEEGAP